MGEGGTGSNLCRDVVELDTVFPGHYSTPGRANHVHILTTNDAKLLLSGEAATSYEGKVLRSRSRVGGGGDGRPIRATSSHFVDLLEDGIAEAAAATSDYDVLMGYQMPSDDSRVEGVLAWITVDVDVSANYSGQAPPVSPLTLRGNAMDGSNSSPTTTSSRHRYASLVETSRQFHAGIWSCEAIFVATVLSHCSGRVCSSLAFVVGRSRHPSADRLAIEFILGVWSTNCTLVLDLDLRLQLLHLPADSKASRSIEFAVFPVSKRVDECAATA